MALSKSHYRTVRTLKNLGYSNRMIATVIGVNRQQINDFVKAENIEVTKGKKLHLATFKNCALIDLAMNTEDDKNKIAALKGVEAPVEPLEAPSVDVTVDIKASILEELKGGS